MGSTASPQNIRHRNLHAYTTRITCNYGAHSVFFFLRVLWWLLLFRLCLCIRERACGNTAIECIGGIKSHFTKFLPSYCYYYAKTKCSENWLQPRLQHVILYRLAFGRSIVGCRLLASHKCTFIPTNTCTFGVCVFVVVPFLFFFFFLISRWWFWQHAVRQPAIRTANRLNVVKWHGKCNICVSTGFSIRTHDVRNMRCVHHMADIEIEKKNEAICGCCCCIAFIHQMWTNRIQTWHNVLLPPINNNLYTNQMIIYP